MRDLIAEGYLIERGPGAATTGRPRAMLEFNPRAELVAAVSLEPSRISCEIADSDGAVIAHRTARLAGDIVDTICRSLPELAGEACPALRGVAIAVPGVSSDGAVRLAPSVGLVEGRRSGSPCSEQLGVPVVVDNDVNLMAAGEHAAGAGKDVADLLLLHVADGIGAGLMLDGQVRRGASGAAGEVGFLPLDPAGPGHGGIGPFEARWSANAIAERVVALHPGRRPDSPVRELVELADTNPPPPAYLDEVLQRLVPADRLLRLRRRPGPGAAQRRGGRARRRGRWPAPGPGLRRRPRRHRGAPGRARRTGGAARRDQLCALRRRRRPARPFLTCQLHR